MNFVFISTIIPSSERDNTTSHAPRCPARLDPYFRGLCLFGGTSGAGGGGHLEISHLGPLADEIKFRWGGGFALPETNSLPMKTPLFPGKYHQNGGFSMAMLR